MSIVRRRFAILAAALTVGGCCALPLATAEASTPASTAAGTATLTWTGPYRTVTIPSASVYCSASGSQYELYAGVHGRLRRLAVNVDVSNYSGPGSYTAAVHVTASGPYRHYARTFEVPLTLTSSGGSATVSRTLPGSVYPVLAGKTVTLSASWSCTP